MAEVELSAAAARERAAAAAASEETGAEEGAEQAPQIVHATTAFLVLWVDGEVIVSPNLDAPIITDHYPTPDEILGAGANLVADRTAERMASLVTSLVPEATFHAFQRKTAEAIQNQQANQLKARLDAERKANGG